MFLFSIISILNFWKLFTLEVIPLHIYGIRLDIIIWALVSASSDHCLSLWLSRNLKNLPSWLASLLQRFVLLTISGIIILLFRFYVNGRGSPLFVESDNPASFSAHFLTRALTYSYLLVLNLWLLVSPSRLCFDWSMGSVPLVENAADPRNIATCSLFVFLLLILLRTTGEFVFILFTFLCKYIE